MSIIRIVLISMLCVVSACGPRPYEGLITLDGTWRGTAHLDVFGSPAMDYPVTASISPDGDAYIIKGMCPNHSDTTDLVASGPFVHGADAVVCPFHTDTCADGRITFPSMEGMNATDENLHVVLTGAAEACGSKWAARIDATLHR